MRGIKGRRWLVIACENKIIFQDLMGGSSKEVARSVMDGKPPTRIAFTFIHSPTLLGRTLRHGIGSESYILRVDVVTREPVLCSGQRLVTLSCAFCARVRAASVSCVGS